MEVRNARIRKLLHVAGIFLPALNTCFSILTKKIVEINSSQRHLNFALERHLKNVNMTHSERVLLSDWPTFAIHST